MFLDHDLSQIARSTIIFLISAIALAGLRPLGQVLAQFMIVWQHPIQLQKIVEVSTYGVG